MWSGENELCLGPSVRRQQLYTTTAADYIITPTVALWLLIAFLVALCLGRDA